MSLDLEAVQALVWTAQLSLEQARQTLDDTQVRPEDLEGDTYRALWAVLDERIRNRQALDVVGIRHALRAEPPERLTAQLTALMQPRGGDALERLRLVKEGAQRRNLVDGLRAIAGQAKAGASVAELAQAVGELPNLLQGGQSRVRNAKGDALAMLDRWQAARMGVGPKALRTGLGDLDDALGGLINNLIVVGARPGVGKSAFVAGLVRNWTCEGHRVGVLCYEDDGQDLQSRIVAHRAGCSIKQVKGLEPCNSLETTSIGEALEWWDGLSSLLELDDHRPSGSPADVLASIRTMASRGCRAVLLDNLTNVRLDGADDRRHDLRVEQVLADIRGEAQRLRIPVIVVGHLRRAQGDGDEQFKPPKLSDFSNSTAWDNYARVALGMWLTAQGPRLRVLKQTNGPSGADFDVDIAQAAAVVTGTRLFTPPTAPAVEPKRTRYPRTQEDS